MTRSEYFTRVADLGCMICAAPAQIHHVVGGSAAEAGIRRGMSQKVSDEHVIPLCMWHHVGGEGIHTIGVETWEARYGNQTDMLIALSVKLEGATIDPPKPRKRSIITKMLPRRHEKQ